MGYYKRRIKKSKNKISLQEAIKIVKSNNLHKLKADINYISNLYGIRIKVLREAFEIVKSEEEGNMDKIIENNNETKVIESEDNNNEETVQEDNHEVEIIELSKDNNKETIHEDNDSNNHENSYCVFNDKKILSEKRKIDVALDYLTGNYTQKSLADKYNCGPTTIGNYCKKILSIDSFKLITKVNKNMINNIESYPSIKEEKEKLVICKEYLEGVGTQRELAKKHNVPQTTINYNIKKYISDEVIKLIAGFNISYRKSKREQISKNNKTPEYFYKNMSPRGGKKNTKNSEYQNVKTVKLDKDSVLLPKPETKMNFSLDKFVEKMTEVKINNNYIAVGLVNNRHNMNINRFIYNKIEGSKTLDFDWLEKEAKEFILSNITFKDGVAAQGLIVRCTGLQSAIMSVTKICYQLKVNLIIEHYQLQNNSTYHNYRQQIIFNDFDMVDNIPYQLTYIKRDIDRLFLFNSQFSDYINVPEFYEIKIASRMANMRNKGFVKDFKPEQSYSILANDMTNAANCMFMLSTNFSMDKTYYRSLILNKYTQNLENLEYKKQILQQSNF